MKAKELLDRVVQKKYRPFAKVMRLPTKGMGAIYQVAETAEVPQDDEENTILIKIEDLQ